MTKAETKHNACFVAGTLVHTDKGLVPIQDIKVGDMVLSRDEFNPQGDLQYKPVLSTFKSQQKERIYKVEYPTNDGMEYIFCNALHPFWSAYDPSGKTGKWEAAEDLSGTFLVNLSGETFGLDNVPFMPVRTLPNYPEGCAYVQFVEDPDFWKNGGGLIEFVKFDSNGYQFISLADNEEAFDEEIKTLNCKTLDAKLRLTPKANFLVDKELYKTLNVRLDQDIDVDTHTAQKFIEAMNKPLIFEGKIVKENSIGNEELYRKALKNIETYGDATGLTEMSLHEAMISFDMPAPNPYEDFVYNLEVDGNHTYFVGHDGIWVHNACPKFSIKDVKPYNKNVPVPKSHSEISKQFMRAVTEDGACFPAGTCITTDKGLKPIEDIQVGDMVLSKPDNGIGEQSYKPVVKTFVNHQQEIYRLTYALVSDGIEEKSLKDKAIHSLSRKSKVFTIRATPNHPFWVKGKGWTSLKELRHGQLLEMKDSQQSAYVILVVPEYQTNHPNISACYGFENVISYGDRDIDDDKNPLYTFNMYDKNGKLEKLLLNGKNTTLPVSIENFGQIYPTNKTMLNTVYNFEVADYHTYYIFDEMWVHNACPKFTFEDVKSYNKNVPVPKSHSEISKQFMRAVTEDGACFPAGTRITTDKGLKRIEDIQVGDMVLSKHESGIGEQEFKPVVRTVVHHNKPIFELTYAVVKNTTKENSLSDKAILKLSQKGNVSVIRATPNHPFWVKGQGWIGLDKLKKGQLLEMKDDDTVAYVICVSPQYQTNFSNIGASYGFENEINFYDQTISELEPQYHLQRYDDKGDRIFLRTKEICGKNLTVEGVGNIQVSDKIKLDTVYNFEVADNHTYYIFDKIWVHNTNCPVIPREKIESYDGSEVPKDMLFFNSLKEANDFFKSLPEDSDLLVPAIVRVGRVKVNSVTKGKINAVDFEHGSRNAIYAKIGDEYIQFEYIAFRKHPNYQTVDTNGVVTTNNSVLNFVKFEGFTEEMINGKLVKSYIDRKASLPYQALSTKKVAPAEKGVDGKLEFANAARHYAIDNLYNQLDSLTRTQNADHNLIYALKKQADIDVFNVQILEAIKDNSFELWKVDTDGHRTRTINGEPTKVWEGYKLKEVDSQSAQYKCKLLNINTNLNITGLITKNNKSMVCQNHLLKRVIKKLTFNGCLSR